MIGSVGQFPSHDQSQLSGYRIPRGAEHVGATCTEVIAGNVMPPATQFSIRKSPCTYLQKNYKVGVIDGLAVIWGGCNKLVPSSYCVPTLLDSAPILDFSGADNLVLNLKQLHCARYRGTSFLLISSINNIFPRFHGAYTLMLLPAHFILSKRL